jgi:hypothetical protein
MPITISAYTEQMTEDVARFNARLRAGGIREQFPASHVPAWLPKIPGRRLFQEFFLAADAGSNVRGAYILKHQDFQIGGQVASIADFHLPISEGAIDRAYVQVGVQLLLDARQRQPLLYALGMGGYDEPLPRLLKASRWEMFSVPFFLRIVRPATFLRNIAHLRQTPLRRGLLDFLAGSGLGFAGIKAWHLLRSRRSERRGQVAAEIVDHFAEWADDLWNACKTHYPMSAVRDAATLQILYPRGQSRFLRLKVTENRKVVGWAVLLNTQMSQHRQFGNMRLGSLVDCLAAPEDAEKVVRCARELLERQGVDLIVSNQAHAAWGRALTTGGFMRGPSNFILATSGELAQRLKAANVSNDRININRGDGDGPINL